MEREHMVPVEKKLRLVQLLRSEDEENRSRMQRREELLYGKSGYYREYRVEPAEGMEDVPAFSSLKLRLIIAFLLMAGFVSWDNGYYKVPGITADQVYEALDEKNSITNLFAFIEDIPYTLDNE